MRPFCIATISAILGIIMGLYLRSIALFVMFAIVSVLVLVLVYTFKRKYIKIICIFAIFMMCFWGYTSLIEIRNEKLNKYYAKQEIEIKAIVTSDKVEKEYKDVYEIRVIGIDHENIKQSNKQNRKVQENQNRSWINNQEFKMLLNLKKSKKEYLELQYGDEIRFICIYEEPKESRNEGGFDYKQYLKTKKILGITSVESSDIKVTGKDKQPIISNIIHDIKSNAVSKIKELLPEDTANLCTGLLLGEKNKLSEDIQESFRNSNLSHMLAISGAHVSYILLGITTVVQKLKLHKRWGKVPIIIFLLLFMSIVGFTPSVTRTCIMAILQLLASILFRKSDIYQNLAISSFIILIFNPYAILDIGFQLSFGGTIGIVVFQNKLLITREEKACNKKNTHENKNAKLYIGNILTNTIKTIKNICIVTISANLLIIPIMMYHFNIISFTFIISNLLAAPILGLSIIFSIAFLIVAFIFKPIAIVLSFLLQPILQLLILIAEISSKLPLSKVLVSTPKIWQIIIYYIILIIIFNLKSLVKSNSKDTQIMKQSLIQVLKSKLLIHKKEIVAFLIFIIFLPYIISIFPSNKLIINFIDVGQGDSILITTPSHKTILIDGGGSDTGSFDVGEKTLIPYLLDKGTMKIDYMMFSHFDTDHCGRITNCYGKVKSKKCNHKQTREGIKQF